MNAEQFNALPLEARRYIENEQGQLCCGKTNNLDLIYKNYLQMVKENLFVLRTGAVYTVSGKTKEPTILYPLYDSDTEIETKEKLMLALAVSKSNPDSFSTINVLEIQSVLGQKKSVDLQKQKNENNDNIKTNKGK